MQFVETYLFHGSYLLAAFLCVFLLTKGSRQSRDGPKTHDWLAALLVLALLAPIFQRDLVASLRPVPGNYFLIREAAPLLVSPLLYLYTRALIHPGTSRAGRDVLHVLPFLAAIALLFVPILPDVFIAGRPGPAQARLPLGSGGPTGSGRIWPLLAFSLAGAISFACYGSRTIALLRSRRENLERYLSFMSAELRLFWIKELLAGLAAVQAYLLAATAAAALGLRHPLLNPSLALDIGYVLFMAFFAYFALRQDRIVFRYGSPSEEVESGPSAPADCPGEGKYRKSALEGERAARILEKLECLMVEEGLSRQGDLTLEDLSRRTSIPRHYLSQAINEGTGRNFYAWVNAYRARDLSRALEDRSLDRRSILDLALECGFNSKSSFTAYFKELAGRTPSEHRRLSKEGQIGSSRSG